MPDLLNNDSAQHLLPTGSNPQVETYTVNVLQPDRTSVGANGTPAPYTLQPMTFISDHTDQAVLEQASLRTTGARSPGRKEAHASGEISHLYADGAGTDHTVAPQPTVASRARVSAPVTPTVNNRPGYT